MAEWWEEYTAQPAAQPASQDGNWWDAYAADFGNVESGSATAPRPLMASAQPTPDPDATFLGSAWRANMAQMGPIFAGNTKRMAAEVSDPVAALMSGTFGKPESEVEPERPMELSVNPNGVTSVPAEFSVPEDAGRRLMAEMRESPLRSGTLRDIQQSGIAQARRGGTELAQAQADIQIPESGLERYAKLGAVSALPTLTGVAAGVITRSPAIGAGVSTMFAVPSAYGEAREAGHSVEDSIKYAGVVGGAEAISERLGFDAILGKLAKRIPAGKLATAMGILEKSVPGRALSGAAVEGTTEALSQAAQNAYKVAGLGEHMTLDEFQSDIMDSFGAGAMIGGPLAGGVRAVENVAGYDQAPNLIDQLERDANRIRTPESDAVDAGRETARAIFAEADAAVRPDPATIDFTQPVFENREAAIQAERNTAVPIPERISPDFIPERKPEKTVPTRLAELEAKPEPTLFEREEMALLQEGKPFDRQALLADLESAPEPELIRNGTRVFYPGDVKTMRAKLAEAGLSEGMRMTGEDGSDVGLYFPARLRAEVDAVLRPKPAEQAQPEPVKEGELPYRELGIPPPRKPRNRVKSAADFDPNYHDIRDFIALHGGLDAKAFAAEFNSEVPSPAENFRFFGKPLFRKSGGLQPDQLRELLQESGFLNPDSMDGVARYTPQDAYDLVDRALDGNPVYHSDGVETQNAIQNYNNEYADLSRRQEYIDEHGVTPELDEEFARRADAMDRGDLEPVFSKRAKDRTATPDMFGATQRAQTTPTPRPASGDLFGAPTPRDRLDAAQRDSDARLTGPAVGMRQGDGELFAGPRPRQETIPPRSSSAPSDPTSWILRDKATGKAVMETADRRKVDALNTQKYEAVPAEQHMQEVNTKGTLAYAAARGSEIKRSQRKQEDDYRGLHRAPSRESGSPLSDLSNTYPDDVYGKNAAQYYGHHGGGHPMDRASVRIIQSYKNEPDAPVKIYRAVPTDAGAEINAGDWVTINKDYAKEHGESQFGDGYKIIEKSVKAKDIYTNGDSIHEWGYDPEVSSVLKSKRPDAKGLEVDENIELTPEEMAAFNRQVDNRQRQPENRANDAQRLPADTRQLRRPADAAATPERVGMVSARGDSNRQAPARQVSPAADAQPDLTGQPPKFGQWFRASKMKDEAAKPMEFHHATDADFEAFDPSRRGSATGFAPTGLGNWFSRDAGAIKGYGSKTLSGHLRLENPKVMDSHELPDLDTKADYEALAKKYKAEGHDGLYFPDSKQAVAFDSVQFKEKGNSGEYSESPNIFKSQRKIDPQTETPAFKKWFKDSKIVKPDGSPMVVYHGGAGGIRVFEPERAGSVKTADWGNGVYFTPAKWQAQSYMEDSNKAADGNSNALWEKMEATAARHGTGVMYASMDLSSKKITQEQYDEIKAIEAEWRKAREDAEKNGSGEVYAAYLRIENPLIQQYDGITDPYLREHAEAKGHDGIIIVHDDGSFDEIVAFRPEQIKSAIGNNGQFDPANPSILKSESAPKPKTARLTDDQVKSAKADTESRVASHWGRSAVNKLKTRGRVEFITKQEVVDRGLQTMAELDGVDGFFDPESGKAYVIVDSGAQSADLPGVLSHEVFHANAEQFLGTDGFKRLKEAFRKLKSRDKDIAAAYKRVPSDTSAAHVDEEGLAYLAQEAPKHRLSERLTDEAKLFLNRLGIPLDWLNAHAAAVRKIAALNLKDAGNRGRVAWFTKDGVKYQKAFHGTPHRDIEKSGFKLNKIGTGEGAQAYGWGIYFAGQKDVAEHYRRALAKFDIEFPDGTIPAARDLASRFVEGADGDKGVAMARLSANRVDDALLVERALAALKKATVRESGQLYHAEIPEDSDLLDWDKPLSEQPEKVRAALLRSVGDLAVDGESFWERDLQALDAFAGGNKKVFTGADLYADIIDALGSRDSRAASEYLNTIGIPGLRYLDGSSRNKGEGSANYVIWDETLLTPEKAQITPYYSKRDKPKPKVTGARPEELIEVRKQISSFRTLIKCLGG